MLQGQKNFQRKIIMKGLHLIILSFVFNSVSCASLLARSGLSRSFIPRARYPTKRSFSTNQPNDEKFGKTKAFCSFVAFVCMTNAVPKCENEPNKVNGLSSMELKNRRICAHIGAFCIPKTETEPSENRTCDYCSCGEDSFSFKVTKEKIYLGVADGVSGSKKNGGDPALFAQTLMLKAMEASDEHHFYEDEVCSNIVNEAYDELVQDFLSRETVPFGSSTACIALIDTSNGKIKFVNVGDSGVLILRPSSDEKKDYKIIFQTKALQYRFNCPYQLAFYSNHEEHNPTDESDTEASYEETKKGFFLKSGDIVLLATDGILDNLFTAEIEEVVNSTFGINESPYKISNQIAKNLSFKALEASRDKTRSCPFNVAQLEQTGKSRNGGKKDDITAVIALIKDI